MPITNTWLTVAGLPFYVEYTRDTNEEGQIFIELLKVTLETNHHDLIDVLDGFVLQSLEEQIAYL